MGKKGFELTLNEKQMRESCTVCLGNGRCGCIAGGGGMVNEWSR